MSEIGLQDETGKEIRVGDVIEFDVWDSDDNIFWKFKYKIATQDQWVYLGGGIDFGTAVGNIKTREQVLADVHDLKAIRLIDPYHMFFY